MLHNFFVAFNKNYTRRRIIMKNLKNDCNAMLTDIISQMLCDKNLTPEARITMVLRYICGKSNKEIETVTGCSDVDGALTNTMEEVSPTYSSLSDDEEEKYRKCFLEIQEMIFTYDGKKYILSNDIKVYCQKYGLGNTKFRRWLYKNGYIKTKKDENGLHTSKNTYLGNGKRARCVTFI